MNKVLISTICLHISLFIFMDIIFLHLLQDNNGRFSILSRLFSRRSSDPLDASNSSDNLSNSSRNTSGANSENSSPRRLNTDVSYSSMLANERTSFMSDVAGDLLGSFTEDQEQQHQLIMSGAGNGAPSDASSYAGADHHHPHHHHHQLNHKRHDHQRGVGDESDEVDVGEDFWGGDNVGGGDSSNRYVSWLSSFSVEQRHTQLPVHQHAAAASPALESSLNSMAVQASWMQRFIR